ncbi:MAG: cupin domain-containing protein [Okeania sp. SIO3B5]|uniref:cupin domain-containing protein n=1 Tax=Okeania sp. SIO3B5 TaxID=2607811 RepID=UPI0013FE7734|nr:cupin domain-containing protein [Okeania sp. SIO3B5]NEO52082.1 cupin domain-containing protein [Okeania sp. SIO3B5]
MTPNSNEVINFVDKYTTKYGHIASAMRELVGKFLPIQVIEDSPPFAVARLGVFSRAGQAPIVEELVMYLPNSRHRAHIHDESDAIIKIITGTGVVVINGKPIPYQPGDVLDFPKSISHGFEVGDEATLFLSTQTPGIIRSDGSVDFRYAD